MDEFDVLHTLVKEDPEAAWPRVVRFIQQHPELAADLVEDFVYEHDERFIGRIEAMAGADPVFRSVVEEAYVAGVATPGAEKFAALQRRLRRHP
jgi:hypothetical protein